jgi:phenylacetic acid degradation operon negative regulatory protein
VTRNTLQIIGPASSTCSRFDRDLHVRGGGAWCNSGVDDRPRSRRRETGAASARSLLLTVLGEFVLPRHAAAWTAALVTALAELGVEEKAARQALSRTAAEGLLTSEREGRRVRWHLTPAGTRLLEEGTERIYGFGRRVEEWDGRWLILTVSVPETQRQLRHRLRTRLTWAGLGSPLPGLWVSPYADKEKEVAVVIEELGVESFSFTGPFGIVGDQQKVVADAWALDAVEERYAAFLRAFRSEKAATTTAAFRDQVRLVQEWRRFPFLDPALPAPLLPTTWPGPAAAALFHARHDHWHAAAQEHWDELAGNAELRS